MSNKELLWLCQRQFMYDPLSGIITRISTGKATGYDHNGYIRIDVYQEGERHRYLAHRIAYLMHYGKLPKAIDHINRDRSDNRIVNLREDANGINMVNKGPQKNNSTGYRGVTFDKKKGLYKAVLCKRHISYHSCKHEAAIAWDKAVLIKYGPNTYRNFMGSAGLIR